jgi:ceramide glucosyltransferase
MEWYHFISLVVVLPQLVFSFQVFKNYRYALRESRKRRSSYQPKAVMIVPCKGLDTDFHHNIRSFLLQDYDNFLLWFVVADEADPAYPVLCELKRQHASNSKAHDIQILIAGGAQGRGQKVHNMLYAYRRIDSSIEVLAFADADACIHEHWLSHIVYPLRRSRIGVTSGYRWFVPKTNNVASLALSAVNAKIVQLLGNTRFNLAWGGSMAIRVETFRQLGLDEIWPRALSDDLVVSRGVKQAGLKVTYVPACLAASVDRMTWSQLCEFAQRQFVITRIGAPRTWWFGLCSSLYSVFGLWGLAAGALLGQGPRERQVVCGIACAVFFLNQMLRAILRQGIAGALLARQRPQMRWARMADVLFFWVWSILLLLLILSSAFRRTITWRGIRYKMVSLTETTMLASDSEESQE